MKHTPKRPLSLLLAVVMLVSLLCTTAFAKDDTFRYVALGDSTTMGYGLNGYQTRHVRTEAQSRELCKEGLFVKMMDYLRESHGNVQGTDLTHEGQRPADLRAALDTAYFEKFDDGNIQNAANYTDQKMDWYIHGQIFADDGYGTYENMQKVYTDALSNADLITYALLMSDYGGYLGYRALHLDSDFYADDTYTNLLRDEGNPALAAGIETLRIAAVKLLKDLPVDMLNQYLDAILYTYANFCVNFSWTMDWIYTHNPDVEVVVVGPYNSMEGLAFEVADGVSLDMGKIWSLLMESMVEYASDFDSHNKQYRFADCMGKVELGLTALADGRYDADFGDRLYREICDTMDMRYADLTPDQHDALLENLAKAANSGTVSAASALSNLNDTDALRRAAFGAPDATAADYGLLHIHARLISANATCSHPDVNGYQQIFTAVKTAYENTYHTGENAYVTRLVTNTVSLLDNSVQAVFGSKTAAAQVQKTLRSVFSPVLRISLK